MSRFFKKEEKKPFTYPAIVERKSHPNHSLWIAGVFILAITSLAIYFLLNR